MRPPPPPCFAWSSPASVREERRVDQIRMPEHQRGVGAAEAEAVGERDADIDVVTALAEDRHVGEGRVEVVDVGALAEEAVLHHQDAVDRFLDAGGAERMAGQRFGGRDRRAVVADAEDLADGVDFLGIADRRRGGVRVDVVDLFSARSRAPAACSARRLRRRARPCRNRPRSRRSRRSRRGFCAPRALACSSSSSTSTPAPPAMTKPSRAAS